MGATKKLNFLIEEEVCRTMEELVPPGKRSKVVNEALKKHLELLRRRRALERLLGCSEASKKLSTKEIVETLAKEREAH